MHCLLFIASEGIAMGKSRRSLILARLDLLINFMSNG